jgi:hypothetical protein
VGKTPFVSLQRDSFGDEVRWIVLVPKLCLGTPRSETLFRVCGVRPQADGKQSFQNGRPQTAFGNEVELRPGSARSQLLLFCS